MTPELDSWREWAAAAFAMLLVTIGGWWKGRLIVRRDARTDASEQRAHDGTTQIIVQLRAEMARLATTVEAMSARLDMETRRRYEAEAKAAELQLRVSVLEAELAELRGAPA